MRTVGVYLIYAAVVLRAAVVLSDEPVFAIILVLLAGYGLLLSGRTWLIHHKSFCFLKSSTSQLAYILLQSFLGLNILRIGNYEDFLALLFVPLSLDAVSFFGRRLGYITIALLSLTMIMTLLFSYVGWLFGLAMGIMYSGVCFLIGGYAYQVQKAKTAHNQNRHMFGELQIAHRQLQGYMDQRASLAVEQERSRLARELHDSVTQTVFSMNLAAQSARLLVNQDPLRAQEQLRRLEELAASALGEIQSLISHLRPHSIVEEGLPTALRRLIAEQKARGLQVSLEIHVDRTLPETVAAGLCSIVHEALINVSKHSGVCEAVVRLSLDKNHSCLEVEDRGLGFEAAGILNQRGHLGLTSMFERAQEIGWDLTVLSQPGQGTRVLVTEKPSGGSE
jgi:signal transduction histidine kinase